MGKIERDLGNVQRGTWGKHTERFGEREKLGEV